MVKGIPFGSMFSQKSFWGEHFVIHIFEKEKKMFLGKTFSDTHFCVYNIAR